MIEGKIENAQNNTNIPMKSLVVEAYITRADGTIEQLGIISGKHKNPVKHYLMQLGIWYRGIKRSWQTS